MPPRPFCLHSEPGATIIEALANVHRTMRIDTDPNPEDFRAACKAGGRTMEKMMRAVTIAYQKPLLRYSSFLCAGNATIADEAATDWWSARSRAATGTTPALTGPDAAPWRRTWALGPSPKDRARQKAPAGEKRWPPKP